MGYAVVMGHCCACNKVFSFHPRKVPSHQGKPICRDCIERVNAKRRQMGNPMWPVPAGAYGPAEEHEIF